MFTFKSILVTGGTGSFGHKFIRYILDHYNPARVIVYSRDEFKQFMMENDFNNHPKSNALRFFIGDIRDEQRFRRALNGVDYVVHAAALKQIPACEYNPAEAIKTNINGAMNIINAVLDVPSVKKVIALSTDKACNPISLYGATKMVSDKLFVAANSYVGARDLSFAIVRYGNVAGSRGSVIPFFDNIIKKGGTCLPITDCRMTRFWTSLQEGIGLVIKAFEKAHGGEIFISKTPSFRVTDLAQAMLPGCEMTEVGIREGEKLHEIMITPEDSMHAYEYDKHFIVYPEMDFWSKDEIIPGGVKLDYGFSYSSDNNKQWLTVDDLKRLLQEQYYNEYVK